MNEIYLTNETSGITPAEVEKCMDELLAQYPDLKKVLIIPPDFTRCYSYAGELTQILYKKLSHILVRSFFRIMSICSILFIFWRLIVSYTSVLVTGGSL